MEMENGLQTLMVLPVLMSVTPSPSVHRAPIPGTGCL